MRGDPELFNLFVVAHALGKTIAEVEAMTVDEFVHWCAFLKIIRQPR